MPLDHALRLAIERIPWDTLEHAYGPASDTPEALAALASASEEERGRGYDYLFYSVYHQGTVYAATVEVVPILIRMLASDGFPGKPQLLCALNLMHNGSSFHEAHRGMMLMGNTDTPEYQAKVDRELSWVNEIKKRVRENLAVYLPLLTAPEWETRLCAPVLLRSLVEDYAAIRPVAVAAFEQETHPLCRPCTLLLMGATGEPIRPRWEAGLKDDPDVLMRVVAAMRVVQQESEQTPPAVIDALMNAMTSPAPDLQEGYAQIPTQGNLTADLGGALSYAGRATVERVIDNLLADLQKGPDVNLQRTNLLLYLTCFLAGKVPFADPTALNVLQQRVARECRRQLDLEVTPGFTLAGFINFTEILQRYGLPSDSKKFDENLTKVPAVG